MHLLLLIIAYGYIPAALFVAYYTLGAFCELREVDDEGFNNHENWESLITFEEWAFFLGNVLVPGWNIFCASLILLVELSNSFTEWVMNVCVESARRRQLREDNKWTTPI